MKVISIYNKPEEAYLVASMLEGSGVKAYVRDAETVGMYWFYSNAIGGVKLEVDDADYERAMEILNLQVEESMLLRCPHCGSSNTKMRELSWIAGLGLVFGFLFPVRTRTVDCADCKREFQMEVENEENSTGGGS